MANTSDPGGLEQIHKAEKRRRVLAEPGVIQRIAHACQVDPSYVSQILYSRRRRWARPIALRVKAALEVWLASS